MLKIIFGHKHFKIWENVSKLILTLFGNIPGDPGKVCGVPGTLKDWWRRGHPLALPLSSFPCLPFITDYDSLLAPWFLDQNCFP
jgi:hypothetical protein